MEEKESRPNHSISSLKRWFAFSIERLPSILNFPLYQGKSSFPEKKMLAISLVFGSFLTVLFLIVGIIAGWVSREYMMNYREIPRPHPEMFDNQGNLIPDEVIAFRFDNIDYEYDDTEEDDD